MGPLRHPGTMTDSLLLPVDGVALAVIALVAGVLLTAAVVDPIKRTLQNW